MKRILLAVCLSVFSVGVGAKFNMVVNFNNDQTVRWEKEPRLDIGDRDLRWYDRDFMIYFETDESGVIINAEIVKSSGLKKLDNKVLKMFKEAKAEPYVLNGKVYAISATQPFTIAVSREVEFKTQPKIIAKRSLLLGSDRSVAIYSEADDDGNVTKVMITKSSMVPELDEYVTSEFVRQAKFRPMTINGKPYPLTKTTWFYFSEKSNTRN